MIRVEELCGSRGGRPGLSVLKSVTHLSCFPSIAFKTIPNNAIISVTIMAACDNITGIMSMTESKKKEWGATRNRMN